MQRLIATLRAKTLKRADSVRPAVTPKTPTASIRRGHFSGLRRDAGSTDATPPRRPVVRAATQPRIATREYWGRDAGFGADSHRVREFFAITESACDSPLPALNNHPQALQNLQHEVWERTGKSLSAAEVMNAPIWSLV